MFISEVSIENFRLFKKVNFNVEEKSTLIVGRNNSGKTSLAEIFRVIQNNGKFSLEDFYLGCQKKFFLAYQHHIRGENNEKIRLVLPSIRVDLKIDYQDTDDDYGTLSDFIIDLSEDHFVNISISYELKAGKISEFFENISGKEEKFFREIKESIPKHYEFNILSIDPTNPDNQFKIEISNFRNVVQCDFINAQRTLDETSNKSKPILGKVLENLFVSASSEFANPDYKSIIDTIEHTMLGIQESIDNNFSEQLEKIIPAFSLFGYPGLADQMLSTETVLKFDQLLKNNTVVTYKNIGGANLPETYNGLGTRNLIYILLKLVEYFRNFSSQKPKKEINLIFIEEPEAHLHPQMQNVFIKKINEIANILVKDDPTINNWPVQFIVTTHSSHIASSSNFESMRYFHTEPDNENPKCFSTSVKDLNFGLTNDCCTHKNFLQKYMTLTKCDLLFADKCILIEGPTERIMLPEIIRKIDSELEIKDCLSTQYISIVEIGGAYAHKFFDLIKFLNIQTLIITDLDSGKGKKGKKCIVSNGDTTTNATIKAWFSDGEVVTDDGKKTHYSIKDLLNMPPERKIKENMRIAYQIPQNTDQPCGRSFEDAFMLENRNIFGLPEQETILKLEYTAFNETKKIDKTDFAIKYGVEFIDWEIPLYIREGLFWLTKGLKEIE